MVASNRYHTERNGCGKAVLVVSVERRICCTDRWWERSSKSGRGGRERERTGLLLHVVYEEVQRGEVWYRLIDPMVWISHCVHTLLHSRFFLLFLFPFILWCSFVLARACFWWQAWPDECSHAFLSTYSLSRGVVFCEWHGVIHVRICNWIVGEREAYPFLCPHTRL